MSDKKSGSRTFLMSVLMSSPGPLVVGLGLLAGRSSTQIADFVRRSSELLAQQELFFFSQEKLDAIIRVFGE